MPVTTTIGLPSLSRGSVMFPRQSKRPRRRDHLIASTTAMPSPRKRPVPITTIWGPSTDAASRTLPFARLRWVMLYVPQRRIIGGQIATSEIEFQELLYHSWPTPKSLNCAPRSDRRPRPKTRHDRPARRADHGRAKSGLPTCSAGGWSMSNAARGTRSCPPRQPDLLVPVARPAARGRPRPPADRARSHRHGRLEQDPCRRRT